MSRKSEVGSPVAETVLICFALKEEAAAFQKRVADRKDISTLITGIGRKNAERSLREFLNRQTPSRVFSCGFAGGLDPELETGAVVFSTDDSALAARLVSAGISRATFCCVSHIAITAAEKFELRRTTGADAVEMESEVIQAVCRERRIPCATVRVISDAAGEDLPLDFNRLAKADMNLDYGKLALALAKSPQKIPALMRLQKQTRFAAEELAAVLMKVISPPQPEP